MKGDTFLSACFSIALFPSPRLHAAYLGQFAGRLLATVRNGRSRHGTHTFGTRMLHRTGCFCKLINVGLTVSGVASFVSSLFNEEIKSVKHYEKKLFGQNFLLLVERLNPGETPGRNPKQLTLVILQVHEA